MDTIAIHEVRGFGRQWLAPRKPRRLNGYTLRLLARRRMLNRWSPFFLGRAGAVSTRSVPWVFDSSERSTARSVSVIA